MKWKWNTPALASGLLDTILPERCALCLRVDNAGYCIDCQTLLPWIDVACRRCARPLIEPGVCGECQNRIRGRPHLNRELVVPFLYGQPLSRHIHQLKYEEKLHFVPAFARLLALSVMNDPAPLPDAIVPVPLHPNRRRARGYNQATLIAKETGRLLGIAVDDRYLLRIRDTSTQTNLDETERRRNMQGAFAVIPARRYDAVAVVDDVVTSGATIDSACVTLRRSGVSRVAVWAIAKT